MYQSLLYWSGLGLGRSHLRRVNFRPDHGVRVWGPANQDRQDDVHYTGTSLVTHPSSPLGPTSVLRQESCSLSLPDPTPKELYSRGTRSPLGS